MKPAHTGWLVEFEKTYPVDQSVQGILEIRGLFSGTGGGGKDKRTDKVIFCTKVEKTRINYS